MGVAAAGCHETRKPVQSAAGARERRSRDLLEFLSTAPGIDCTAIQTVGEKGWDGFVLAVVAGD
jgi:hypothetical protein